MNLMRWDPFRELEGIQARLNENLLGPDEDVVKVRRMIASAFTGQLLEGRRDGVPPGALDFPV